MQFPDRLKQIPVSCAVCLLLTVVSRTVIQLFTFDLFWAGSGSGHTNCESVICPKLIQCGLQDIKIQTLTIQKEALKRKRNPTQH